MLSLSLIFPLADIVFLTPPKRETVPDPTLGLGRLLSGEGPALPDWLLPAVPVVAVIVLIALVVFAIAVLRPAAAPADPGLAPRWILVDGSNVMHWKDNRPDWLPLRQVVGQLGGRGFTPGVVFDANAGYKLTGAYMNDRALARALGIPAARVLVAPKGTPADVYLLETARDLQAPVVTNDRYRDWAESYPEIAEAGFLVRGGFREGEVWMEDKGEADPQGGAMTGHVGAQ